MPEVSVGRATGTAVSRDELAFRVARMFERDGCPREIIAHIVNDTSYNELNQLANLPRIHHVSRLSRCCVIGDMHFDGQILSILIEPAHRNFIRIRTDDHYHEVQMQERMLERSREEMLLRSTEEVRRALDIESTNENTNEHDHARDIESIFRDALVTPIIDASTATTRFEYSDSIVAPESSDTKAVSTLSEKDEKLIKVANIIKDSMLVELELFYNPDNDTFELSAIDGSTDSKVLILKGHGKDKADLLKEHFEL